MRIGNFINPETQEEDWIESESITDIVFAPKRVTKVGDTFETAIDFTISHVEPETTARFVATYVANMRTYNSEIIDIDLEDLAEEIARIVYAKKTLDESTLIKEAKEQAIADLTAKLFNENIVLGNLESNGIGYVTVQNKKVITIDRFSFNYGINPENERTYTAELFKCVGPLSLNNLEDPQIKFYTGTHEIILINPRVTGGSEGKMSNYKILADNIAVEPHVMALPAAPKDEEDFIKLRMSMLDSLTNGSDEFDDDRFDDII